MFIKYKEQAVLHIVHMSSVLKHHAYKKIEKYEIFNKQISSHHIDWWIDLVSKIKKWKCKFKTNLSIFN